MKPIKDLDPLLPNKKTDDQPNTTQNIPTPSPSASPGEIRTYLSHLLTTKRSLPPAYVRPLVARWKLGSGQELRSYSPAMYLRIFGPEDGWIIYREVMLAKLHEEARSKTTLQKSWIYIPATLTLSFMLVIIILIKRDVVRGGKAVLLLTLGIFLSVFTLGFPVVAYLESQTPEQIVEGELYDCTKNMMARPQGDEGADCAAGLKED